MIKFLLSAIVSALLLTVPVLANENALTIEWEDLVPKMEPLEDPFTTLTTDQLLDLQTLFWIRDIQKHNSTSEMGGTSKDAEKRRRRLTGQGLDVDNLMAAIDRFENELAKRNQMTNTKFDGQFVRIPGYALPLEHKDMGVTEFLLVPYVGACIHVEGPPPNQTLYVSLKEAYTVKDLYEPVWITGHLSIKAANKSLSLVDGSADVETAYTLDGIKVIPYEN